MEQQQSPPPRRTLLIGVTAMVALIGAGVVMFSTIEPNENDSPGRAAESTDRNEPVSYGEVPSDVTFVERSGETVSLGDFRGEPWIASFIFTKCQGTCPIMTASLKELQSGLDAQGTPVRLVSFTVDPENDDPETLASYAEGYGADDRWLFLTAPESVVQPLALETFHLAIEEGSDPKEPIIHSSRFILVDGEGEIRGYFEGRTEEGRASLLEAVKKMESKDGN